MRRFCCWYLVCAALILTVPVWAQTPKEQQPDPPPAADPKDAFGDPLPPGAVARIGTVRYRVAENYIFQPQMSPDGKLLAASGNTGPLELWELPAWIKRKTIALPKASPRTVAFTDDSKQLVVFDQRGQYHLVDLAAGKPVLTSKAVANKGGPQNAQPSRLVVSRDQQTVIRHYSTFGKEPSHRVVVWDLAKNEVTDSLTIPVVRPANRANSLAFSADGRYAAHVTMKPDPEKKSKGEYGVEIWNLKTLKLQSKFDTGMRMVYLAFAPDGNSLAGVSAQTQVRVYDIATGKLKHSSALKGSTVSHLAYSPDGKTIYLADQENVFRYDSGTLMQTGKFQAPLPVAARQFAFPPDGKVLALALSSRALHHWEATTGQLFSPKGVPAGAIADLRFAPDQSLFVACMSGSVSWWDPHAGVKLRDLKLDGKDVLPFGADPRGTQTFSLSPTTEIIVGSNMNYGGFDLFETKSGKKLFGEQSKNGEVSVHFFDADRKVAVGSGKTFQVRDPRSGKELYRLDLSLRQQERLMRFEISPSGKQIAVFALDEAADFDRLFLFEVEKKKSTREWPVQDDYAAMRFSPDGHWLGLSDASGNLLLVDIGRGGRDHMLTVLPGRRGDGGVTEVAFSADGRQVACATGMPYVRGWANRIFVFEMASKKIRLELPGHAEGAVMRLAFSPDGALLASGSADTSALTWKAGLRAFADKPAAKDTQPDELNDWFAKLAGPDAKAAFQAMIKLAQTPAQAVKLFESKIEPARKPDPGDRAIPRLIQDLGSDAFTVRTKADQTLQKLGAAAESDLRKAMQGTSLETRRRIEVLLDRLVNRILTNDELRHIRAVEVLETIASPDARALLTRWTGGDPSAILTVEARKALALP